MMKKIIILCALAIINSSAFCQAGDTIKKVKEIDIEKDILSIEVEAEFDGGTKEWLRYLQNNLRMEVAEINGAPAGRYKVIVKFFVDKEGNVSDIVPQTKHGFGMEKEVIRIIKKSPKWRPATFNGQPVKAKRTQPVTFIVNAH